MSDFRAKLLDLFSIWFPYLIFVLVFLGILLSLFLHRTDFIGNGLILSFPAIIAAFLIIITDTNKIFNSHDFLLISIENKYLYSLFSLLSCSLVVSMLINLNLLFISKIFFISLYIICFLEIFSKKVNSKIILGQIVLLLLLRIYNNIISGSFYFGWTDFAGHLYYINITQLLGHTIPIDLDYGYSFFPLYHVSVAISSILLNVIPYYSVFLTWMAIFSILILFIYYIFKKFTLNNKIALLTCLIYSFDPIIPFFGSYFVPRVCAYVGFVISLYLMIKIKSSEQREFWNVFYVLLLILYIYLVTIHQVSSILIIIILTLLLFCEWYVLKIFKFINPTSLIIYGVIFFFYWIYIAFLFIKSLIGIRFASAFDKTIQIQTYSSDINSIIFLIENLHFIIFLFFAILGIWYLLTQKKDQYLTVIGLFSLITIFLYIPSPLSTIWQLIKVLNIERFMLLLSPFMAFIFSIGIIILVNALKRLKVPRSLICLLIILSLIIYASVSLGLIKYESERTSFTSGEFSSIQYIYSNIKSGSTMYSDYQVAQYFNQKSFSRSDQLNIKTFRSITINQIPQKLNKNDYFIFSKNEYNLNGLTFSKGGELNPEGGLYRYSINEKSSLNYFFNNQNKIYTNNIIDLIINK